MAKPVVKVSGNLPGSAILSFAIDEVTATGDCAADVVTEIITAEAPVASRASGTAVYRGTKVELTTGSKDAVIYFTTDGSCPCDADGTRRKYTVPIVIEEDTHILAMTSVGNGDDDVSETVEFNYTIKHSDIDFQMAEGWTWISHNLADGADVAELAADPSVTRILSQTGEAISDPQARHCGYTHPTLSRRQLQSRDLSPHRTHAPQRRGMEPRHPDTTKCRMELARVSCSADHERRRSPRADTGRRTRHDSGAERFRAV